MSALDPGQLRGPPVPATEQYSDRRHEQRTDKECVQQDCKGDRESELTRLIGVSCDRQDRECAGQDQARWQASQRRARQRQLRRGLRPGPQRRRGRDRGLQENALDARKRALEGAEEVVGMSDTLHRVLDVAEAVRRGLSLCQRGDVLLFSCATTVRDFADAIREMDPESAALIEAQVS